MARLLLCALFLVGCDVRWSAVVSDLDRVPLSAWAVSKSDVFAVGGALGSGGEALFLRWDGSSGRTEPTGTQSTLWWVHGFSSNDVWAVGEKGAVLHWDGATLTPESSGTDKTLYGVWGARPGVLWAVGGMPGGTPVLLRRDGGAWSTVTTPTPAGAYFKVWGSAEDDVFVCGEGGTIVHWDGKTWSAQQSGVAKNVTLFTVHGRSSDDVVAVGGFGRGVAVRYDGTRWSPLADPLLDGAGSLAGVSIDADGTFMIVGASGTKLRGRAGTMVDDTLDPPRDDLHAAFSIEGTHYAVGGNYLAPPGAARRGVLARR